MYRAACKKYLIVFCFRYLDLLWSFVSVYVTVMKIFYITSTGYLVYMMRMKPPVATTYDRSQDSFQYEKYLLPPCLLVGLLLAEDWSIPEVLWCSSMWIESVSIVPQLMLLQQIREVENLYLPFRSHNGRLQGVVHFELGVQVC